ncbi:MAG: crossover junction endodeoxyribonuclease RuvC [Methylacidiphilales bacterium]|nr:crossover junction endodeoxyribonuclease RuvC [Candidatus Methylacidiphilales bacterium]
MPDPLNRIIGIDPGLKKTGYGVMDSDGVSTKHIASGVICPDASKPLGARLLFLSEQLAEIFQLYNPKHIAVEDVFMSINAKSSLMLGYARGICMCEAYKASPLTFTYSAKEVKLSVVGNGSADKNQVQYMVGIILNIRNKMEVDASDALAVGICHAHSYRAIACDSYAK